ncbi:MAG: hypothetical protein H7A04_18350 [Pseudomonadales bacterium]|nr:hypothetical protein [Pseudomonadales bacterium]
MAELYVVTDHPAGLGETTCPMRAPGASSHPPYTNQGNDLLNRTEFWQDQVLGAQEFHLSGLSFQEG